MEDSDALKTQLLLCLHWERAGRELGSVPHGPRRQGRAGPGDSLSPRVWDEGGKVPRVGASLPQEYALQSTVHFHIHQLIGFYQDLVLKYMYYHPHFTEEQTKVK